MKGARGPSRPPGRRPSRAPSAEPRERKPVPAAARERPPRSLTLGTLAVWALLLVPPFLVVPAAKDSFRLPKLMASEWLALLSLLFLAWGIQRVERVQWSDLWRLPALRAVLPLLLVATLGSLATDHPHHVREALADLWIGAACLVGWSVGLSSGRMERLLRGLLWPASALALIGILQFHDILQPLRIYGVAYDPRLALTSTAGNPGDLGAYLVLPCLIAQWLLARGWGTSGVRARSGIAAALGVCLYALLLTRTLAAVAALGLASLILWGLRLPRRRAVLLLAGGAALAAVLVLAVPPLRERVFEKAAQARQGQLNAVLTGRLDGWNAALWMLRENPWTGVGHGAFRPEYVPAKLALLDRGVEFYPQQVLVVFANAHNEFVEVAADSGWPGLLALGCGLWVLGVTLRRRANGDPGDGAFAWAGVAALAVLSLAHFPFRIALVAFPAILFLAWVLRPVPEEAAA